MKLRKVIATISISMLAVTATAMLGATSSHAATKKIRIAIMPKIDGIPYYQVVKRGVDEAAKSLSSVATVQWVGPKTAEASEQIQLVQNLINAKVDVIAIAANDPAALAPILKKAQAAGIKVMSWDGDANVRSIFVQLIDPNAFGGKLADLMAEQVGEKADVAVVTSTFTAANQTAWLKGIKAQIAKAHPGLNIVTTVESGEDQQVAMQKTKDIINSYPNVKGIFAITTAADPGAAQAVESLGLVGKIAVIGNATPNAIRQYIKSGTLKNSVLWNPADHGYLSVYTAYALSKGQVKVGKTFKAGRLGTYKPAKDAISSVITLSPPLVFTKENIDKYNF